ncbi:hypothetical protein FSP39_022351 [Pinctada imbricata]|uniref:C2H2-type domain-containing protein n=1 Tax=Pinctada imbricata TaxID=66713 RepID=A0AA88XJW0_PINIB|nr:hypothetical protein FSP39_022351 [Pinctada imbricata]
MVHAQSCSLSTAKEGDLALLKKFKVDRFTATMSAELPIMNERGNQEIYIDGLPVEIPAGNFRTEVMPDGSVQVVVYQNEHTPDVSGQGIQIVTATDTEMLPNSIINDESEQRDKRIHSIGIQNTTVPKFNSYDLNEMGVQTDPYVEEDVIDPDIENKEIMDQKSNRPTASANIIHTMMSEDNITTKTYLRGGKMVSFKKCGICGKCYKNKGNWMTHLKTHQKEEVYMCGFCGQIFPKALFPQHLKTHRKEAEEEKAKNQQGHMANFSNLDHTKPMNVHVNSSSSSPIKAANAAPVLKVVEKVKNPIDIDERGEKGTSYLVKSHQVTLPNQQVATVIDLGNLLNVAMNADTLGQEESMNTSTTANIEGDDNQLQIDQDDGELDETKTKYIYKCNVCGKEYNNKSNCHRHLKTHTHDKTYRCPYCDRTYMHRYELKMHMRVHTGEKPHKCPVCTRGFNEAGNLRRHMKIHAGDDTPYKCGICFKGFSDMFRLQVHLKVHSGEIVCDTCGKRFGKISDLYRHIRIHTGDKPYKCDICNKSFCQKVNLQTHYRTHSGKSPFKCTICNFSFSRKVTLDNHMSGHDPDEIAEHEYNLQMQEEGAVDAEFLHIKEEPKTPAPPEQMEDEEESEILVQVATIDPKTGLVEVAAEHQEIETGLSQEELAQLVEATIVTTEPEVENVGVENVEIENVEEETQGGV